MQVKLPIIPDSVILSPEKPTGTLNLNGIAVFAALGFFLDKDCYFQEQTALQPATIYDIDQFGNTDNETKYWKWFYKPVDRSLKQVTEEFAHLFERIIKEQTENLNIILPLSGGLDSRTLAAALSGNTKVHSYSYEFKNGIPETRYAGKIAQQMGFEFESFVVPEGYLWKDLDALADINRCYAEFTNPRQMAFINEYERMGDMFLLGHWGDVLFDNMGLPDMMSFDQQVEVVLKKIVRKGGMEIGNLLWTTWNLPGNFKDYLLERVSKLLADIKIENTNARLRAFKSMYWAPRWTSVNMRIFSSTRPIALPYYHDDMCKFICSVPEVHLAGRRIQIEYLKVKSPELASMTWQAHKPFNLYNYEYNRTPLNLPYRFLNKCKNLFRKWSGMPLVQRNWELQFLGEHNDLMLRDWLFENIAFDQFVSKEVRKTIYDQFITGDKVYWSHPVSMLLTLSVFARKNS